MRYHVFAEVWNDESHTITLVKTVNRPDPDAACHKAVKELNIVVADSGDPSMRYRIYRVVPARRVRRKR